LIDLNEAAECDFITYSHGPINKSPSTRIQFENLCYLSGFTPKIKYECDTPETLIEMVSADLGVSLIPTNTLMQCKKKNISVIHLSNHGMSRMIYLSWHKEKYMSTACKFFKQHCMEFFRQKTK
jgi:DNA-binding transcriptional LysR family regulator